MGHKKPPEPVKKQPNPEVDEAKYRIVKTLTAGVMEAGNKFKGDNSLIAFDEKLMELLKVRGVKPADMDSYRAVCKDIGVSEVDLTALFNKTLDDSIKGKNTGALSSSVNPVDMQIALGNTKITQPQVARK